MLINVCIIEAGGVVGATSQKYICCLFVLQHPKNYSLFGFKWSKSKFKDILNELLKIDIYSKMHIEMKKVWWVQSLMKVYI